MSHAYESAARRHFTDAETLASTHRFDNAGHLLGFAVECALKHAYGIVEADNASPKVHLPDLANALLKRVSARNVPHVPLRSLLEQTKGGFFHDWKVNDRYSADGTIAKATYDRWNALAKRAFGSAGIRR